MTTPREQLIKLAHRIETGEFGEPPTVSVVTARIREVVRDLPADGPEPETTTEELTLRYCRGRFHRQDTNPRLCDLPPGHYPETAHQSVIFWMDGADRLDADGRYSVKWPPVPARPFAPARANGWEGSRDQLKALVDDMDAASRGEVMPVSGAALLIHLALQGNPPAWWLCVRLGR